MRKSRKISREYKKSNLDWEGITFPSEKDDWKRLEKNNVAIDLNFRMLKNFLNIFSWFYNYVK